ncbi:MAG: PEGA domain-containing protein [Myxococcaceae bacterium]
MRMVQRVLVLGVWALFSRPAKAQTALNDATALVYLRPTKSADFKVTQLDRIVEAQKLRTNGENALEAVAGRTVLHHADLRAALGSAYLVDAFDCAGVPACLVKRLAPLRTQGMTSVVVGEYTSIEDKFLVRLRLLALDDGRVLETQQFGTARDALETLDAWRRPIEALFNDTGALRIVTNIAGYRCLLDGQPCAQDTQGRVTGVREGEHLLVLEKDGHRPFSKAISVTRRQELRVVAPVEQLPVQVRPSADPNAQNPKFEESDEPSVKPYAYVNAYFFSENSDNTSSAAARQALPRETSGVRSGISFNLLVVGARALLPKIGKWQVSAVAANEFTAQLPFGWVEIGNPDIGFRAALGVLFPGPVNSLGPGTLHTPFNFGNLFGLYHGLVLTQSVGSFVFQASVARARGTSGLPGVTGRIAYISRDSTGTLYGAPQGLMLSLSGIWGKQGLGRNEAPVALALDPGAATPRVEELPYWIGSFELAWPFASWATLAGEAYAGQGADILRGAINQGARLDLATGRHSMLRSVGGWAQLTIHPWTNWDFRLLYGHDTVLSGLTGVQLGSSVPPIESNQLMALILAWTPLRAFTLGLQVHRYYTVVVEPERIGTQLFSAVFTATTNF